MFKQHFDNFVCDADFIVCHVDGIKYTARLMQDAYRRATDDECYTEAQLTAWRADEWHFFGVVISASKNGVQLGDHLASLWGIEGNFPNGLDNPNAYFLDVANELLDEAKTTAHRLIAHMLAALSGPVNAKPATLEGRGAHDGL